MNDIQFYLNWLAREQANSDANLVNLFGKTNGTTNGKTVKTADAIIGFADFDPHKPYDAIWATVHSVNPNTTNKSKLVKSDIDAYRYLAVDVDSRVAHTNKVSATDEERAKTVAKADEVGAFLKQYGMPQPLKIMSGNGALLLFPIDLPNTTDNYALMERLGKTLADKFNDADCDIDEAVIKDPSRILGVVGTFNRSKSEVPSENRYAKMRAVVGEYPNNVPMTADAFKTLAGTVIAEQSANPTNSNGGNEPLGWDSVMEKRTVSESDRFDRCRAYLENTPNAVQGQNGSDKTLRAASECIRFGLSDEQCRAMMEWFNLNKCEPIWSNAEIEHKIESAKGKAIWGERLNEPMATAKDTNSNNGLSEKVHQDYPLSDLGNAEHFADTNGENIRYVVAWKSWVVFDGRRWARDTTDKVGRMALRFVRRTMPNYAVGIADDERRAKYLKWASQCQAKTKIDAMVGLAQTVLACSYEIFDAKPNLFNVINGTIELDTMLCRPHNRNDMLMRMSQAVYDLQATAPTWERFIDRIFRDYDGKPRGAVIEYIKRAVGYTLTADDSAQCMFVLFGGGRNGKTTFLDAVKGVMGEYAITGLQSVLLKIGDGNGGRNTDDEAALFGARMVGVSETTEGQAIDEAKLKRLVGSGQITAMRKFEQPFSFQPTHKIWLDCNHKPRVKGNDEGIWRRIKLVPFMVQIPFEERDEKLGEKLKAETSGILNWALQGLSAWRADGLNEPKEIRDAVGEYRSDSDTFGSFLCDCIENNDVAKTSVGEVFNRYLRWASENGEKYTMTKIAFGRKMGERGYQSKTSNSNRCFVGCSIRNEPYDGDGNNADADTVDERLF